jgi:hypothetical protein
MNKMAQKLAELENLKLKQMADMVKLIPGHIREERMSICNSCEHLFKPTSTCKKCGCFMKMKTYLPEQRCPLNKWVEYSKLENKIEE